MDAFFRFRSVTPVSTGLIKKTWDNFIFSWSSKINSSSSESNSNTSGSSPWNTRYFYLSAVFRVGNQCKWLCPRILDFLQTWNPTNGNWKESGYFPGEWNFRKWVMFIKSFSEYRNIILKFLLYTLINKIKLGFDRGVPSHLSILAYCTPTIIAIGFWATSRQFESFRHNSTTRSLMFMDSIKICDSEEDILKQNPKTFVLPPEST